MEDVARTIPEPQWARLTDLKAGDTVELHGFNCAQGVVTIEQDIWGDLFFQCTEGKHYVENRLDQDGYLIGITIRPAALIIPITQERIMNLDANDANSVSSFFQSLADKVVLASTLPQKVEELSAVVDKLKADVEQYREHMARADEEISNLRRERAALQDENAALRNENAHLHSQLTIANTRWDQACQERDGWHNDSITVSNDLEAAKRERDDAQMRVMELERDMNIGRMALDDAIRERNEALDKLSSIRSALA